MNSNQSMARFHPKKYVKPTRHLTDKKLLKPSHNSKNPSSSTFPYWKNQTLRFQIATHSSKLVKPAEPASASPTPPATSFPQPANLSPGLARPSRSYHGSSGFPPPTPCGRCWRPRAVRGTWYPSWRRLHYACVAGAVRAYRKGVDWKVMERCPKKKVDLFSFS